MSVETPEYAAMVRRIVRAHGRRVAEADPEDLVDLVGLHAVVDQAVREAVRGQRERGASWAAIARGLGTSRQAAWDRFASCADASAHDLDGGR
jgi:hypothetical protein